MCSLPELSSLNQFICLSLPHSLRLAMISTRPTSTTLLWAKYYFDGCHKPLYALLIIIIATSRQLFITWEHLILPELDQIGSPETGSLQLAAKPHDPYRTVRLKLSQLEYMEYIIYITFI